MLKFLWQLLPSWLTAPVCKRWHIYMWLPLANGSTKIPFRMYTGAFHCRVCKQPRYIEYPYCSICRLYATPKHECIIDDIDKEVD